jgi:hypothetical protein
MNTYPLVYSCREVVAGETFSAAIDITGRAVLELDAGEWSVAAVDPAGFADCGATPVEAYENFRMTLKTILFDFVEANPRDFMLFCSAVRSFGATKNRAAEARWLASRAEIRNGAEVVENFAACLPKRTSDVYASLTIVRLDEVNREVKEKMNVLAANENLSSAA